MQTWMADEGLSGGIDTTATQHLPNGWFLIRRFRIDARPQQRPPAEIADLLGSSGGARTRLVGGLTVAGLRRAYLVGGLPFLALPSDDDVVPVELELNGSQAVQLRAEGGELSLNGINLGPGEYRLTHPRGSLSFDVFDGMSRQPGLRRRQRSPGGCRRAIGPWARCDGARAAPASRSVPCPTNARASC